MAHKIITTQDGSHSLLLDTLDETYHSRHGALTESQYVFIGQGLNRFWHLTQPIDILEVGFGTGLNALLTAQAATHRQQLIHYHSLEPHPIPDSLIHQLNYAQLVDDTEGLWAKIHAAAWGQRERLNPYFELAKYEDSLEQFAAPTSAFDLMYFDAFAPNKQPSVWSLPNLQKCYQALRPGGVLVSYCAQGQFRRHLAASGFEVAKLPGPPGKREMVSATKPG